MLAPIARIDFTDYSESIPAFAVVSLMCFTYNIAVGITAGFLLYPFCKLVQGKAREIEAGLWVLAGLSLLFFVFYPYLSNAGLRGLRKGVRRAWIYSAVSS